MDMALSCEKIQGLYREMAKCWLDNHFGSGKGSILADDDTVQKWWDELVDKIPAFRRSVDPKEGKAFKTEFQDWGGGGADHPRGTMNKETVINVVSTIMTWVSWIHEDVGHSAAAYVYNPIHTHVRARGRCGYSTSFPCLQRRSVSRFRVFASICSCRRTRSTLVCRKLEGQKMFHGLSRRSYALGKLR